MRVRASIFLVAALLLAILLISGYTIRILIAQQKLVAEEVQDFRTRALTLLATRIEQSMLSRIRSQIADFKEKLPGALNAGVLEGLRQSHPETEELLMFGPDFGISARWITPSEKRDESLDQWLIERIRLNEKLHWAADSPPFTFVEKVHGHPSLFAVSSVQGNNHDKDWMIVRYDLNRLLELVANPLLTEWSRSLKGEIELVDPETWDKDTDESEPYIARPIGRVLNGWMLCFTPSTPQSYQFISSESASIVGITSAVVLALIMATFSVWRELRREQAMADLRNRFVTNVTHELKTPLALIRMYAETLSLGRIREAERQRQYHHTILHEAERLSEMITKVLDFSSAHHGAEVYPLEETDLKATLEQFVRFYAEKIKKAGLRLNLNLDSDVPPVLHNRYGVIQLLINLVDNTIKYGVEGGVIAIDLQHRKNAVRLAVRDFGPGIPKEEQERMLLPFERGPSIDPAGGTGLGLALVAEIVKVHGAKLKLNNSIGRKGLTVSVLFPNYNYSLAENNG